MGGSTVRLLSLVCTTLLVAALACTPSAAAVEPPEVDLVTDIAPPDGDPAPAYEMYQNTVCETSVVLADSQFGVIPASATFGVSELHKFARGDGQVVAVIDSGVQPVSRLPRLRGGGDYIMSGDGLSDCDHHGTLVAGIIAAAPSPGDAFVGVAPGAEILSIRQTSAAFTERPARDQGQITDADRSAANLMALAKAIVHAANLGATVINLSVTACAVAGSPTDTRALAGALYYASVVRDVVIIGTAGNTTGSDCEPNPGYDPANPADPRNWDGVKAVALPAYYSNLLLTVGGTTLTGDPYANSMSGPWVGAAAPAMNIVSLDPTEPQPGALTNAAMVKGAPTALNGTSFATAYVAGLAALIREKYPKLSARQVINRILLTAHTPAQGLTNTLGAGPVDAIAALTADLPAGEIVAPGVPSIAAPPPAPVPPADNTARNIALAVFLSAVAVLTIVALTVFAIRRSDAS